MNSDLNNLSEKDHTSQSTFPYEELLLYYRRELRDPRRCADAKNLVETDPRWKAHFESVEFLDLERAAAIQDGKDLQELLEKWGSGEQEPSYFCLAVAETKGAVFDPLIRGETDRDREIAETGERWTEHVDRCVYCRRMRRLAHARCQRESCKPRIEEPLLRDWLLKDHYSSVLGEVTEWVVVFVEAQAGKAALPGSEPPWWKRTLIGLSGRIAELGRGTTRLGNLIGSAALQHRFATAACVLVMCTGAGWANSWAQLQGIRDFFGLDSFCRFVAEDEDHPSTDPTLARPVVIVGQDVWLKGEVKSALIQEVQVAVEPGLKKGGKGPTWESAVAIDPDEAHAGVVPFDISFSVPKDRVTRKVTVRLIPRPEALAAAPESLRDERLTYQVNVACLRAGPIAYVPDKPGPTSLRGLTEVTSVTASVEIEVDERLLGMKDVWVGVIPDADTTSVWLQGNKLSSPESTRIVFLVLDPQASEGEFQVVVLSCPKGTFAAKGPIPVSEIDEEGAQILESIHIRRTK